MQHHNRILQDLCMFDFMNQNINDHSILNYEVK